MLFDKHACWALLLWSVCDVFLRRGWRDSAGRRRVAWASSTGASSVDVRTVGGVRPSHGPEPGSCVTLQPQPGNNVSAVLSTWTPELPQGLQALKVSWPCWYPDPQCTSMALVAACLLLACSLPTLQRAMNGLPRAFGPARVWPNQQTPLLGHGLNPTFSIEVWTPGSLSFLGDTPSALGNHREFPYTLQLLFYHR